MQVYELWQAHKGDIVSIVAQLWGVTTQNQPAKDGVQQKWQKIREICDAHDEAMDEFFRRSKK